MLLPQENVARLETHGLRAKGEPRPNPTDFAISLRAKFGSDQQIIRPGERRQPMRGFEEHYTDIIDFIVRATHRIWEEKDVGYIYDHYRHNIRVIDDSGLAMGRDRVVQGTLQYINAFPDIRIYADEVVWAGNDEVGFHTSHRAFITGRNTGYSQYGPPTGKRVEFWLIANCIFVANENYEEWVIYNNSAMLQQMGFDLRREARASSKRSKGKTSLAQGFGERERLLGQGKPRHLPPRPSNGFDVEDFIRRAYHYIWNWRRVAKVKDAYAPNMRFFGATDRTFYGRGNYEAFVLSMLAMFPDLVLHIDDLYWMGNDEEGYVTSVRWSLVGTHLGHGVYGPPTDRSITMWGITQHEIRNGRIEQEWMMWNEFDVMQQIYGDDPRATDDDFMLAMP